MPRFRKFAVTCALTCTSIAVPTPAGASADAESAMIREINQFRASHGVPRLRESGTLAGGASRWSRHLIARDAFHHSNFSPRGFRAWGEALELHWGSRARVSSSLSRLKASSPHRALLLRRDFRLVGAGRDSGRFRGRRATIWTIRLGTR